MRAAIAGRQDPGLTIAARTSAISVAGVEDTVARVAAYQETGVDAIFLGGIKQKQHIEAIAKVCRLPLILGGVGPDIMDLNYLGPLGIRICLQSHQPVMAAIQATYNTLKALREGVKPSRLNNTFDKELFSRLSPCTLGEPNGGCFSYSWSTEYRHECMSVGDTDHRHSRVFPVIV